MAEGCKAGISRTCAWQWTLPWKTPVGPQPCSEKTSEGTSRGWMLFFLLILVFMDYWTYTSFLKMPFKAPLHLCDYIHSPQCVLFVACHYFWISSLILGDSLCLLFRWVVFSTVFALEGLWIYVLIFQQAGWITPMIPGLSIHRIPEEY